MEDFSRIFVVLDTIINDRTVPKNIRKAAEDSKAALNESTQTEVKVSTAVGILDEIINDPNMPTYTRMQIWNVVSLLEQMRK